MKKVVIGALFLAGLAAAPVWAGQKVSCVANGPALARNGQDGLLEARARIDFEIQSNEKGLRRLVGVSGYARMKPSMETDSGWYIGRFKFDRLTENPNYRPTVYKRSSQFQDFDAYDTRGSREEGMWGVFILDKNTAKSKFAAHYIVQAGDHFGGTLHLSCKTRR